MVMDTGLMMRNLFSDVKGSVSCLIDGQWGSTGKGLLAAYVINEAFEEPQIFTTNASANAGHTTITEDGKEIVCFHLPTSGVMSKNPNGKIYLNAGSIIDIDLLGEEIEKTGVDPKKILIHPHAAVITDECKEEEMNPSSAASKIASTRKGVGAALVRKIKRQSGSVIMKYRMYLERKTGAKVGELCLNRLMQASKYKVFMEIPQGFGLGINNGGFFPHCTSREVSVSQGLSDAGIHPSFLNKTIMSLRTLPIRVGNIMDEEGRGIGYSGGCYSDQEETNWEKIGVRPEITTVTGRVRRVFTWSKDQFERAYSYNRPDILFLNFVNYLGGKSRGMGYGVDMYHGIIEDIWGVTGNHGGFDKRPPKILLGTGPKVSDIFHTDGTDFLERMGWV